MPCWALEYLWARSNLLLLHRSMVWRHPSILLYAMLDATLPETLSRQLVVVECMVKILQTHLFIHRRTLLSVSFRWKWSPACCLIHACTSTFGGNKPLVLSFVLSVQLHVFVCHQTCTFPHPPSLGRKRCIQASKMKVALIDL